LLANEPSNGTQAGKEGKVKNKNTSSSTKGEIPLLCRQQVQQHEMRLPFNNRAARDDLMQTTIYNCLRTPQRHFLERYIADISRPTSYGNFVIMPTTSAA
jgi:hypothetical protein